MQRRLIVIIREMMTKPTKVFYVIMLTIVGNINGGAGGEDSENIGTVETCGICGAVLDLVAETESVSIHVCHVTGRVIYLGPDKRGAGANGIGDTEAVLREGIQNSTRVIEELEGLVTNVCDGCGDLQVLRSIDPDADSRTLHRQAGRSGGSDHRGDESNERTMEGRGEHRDEGDEGGTATKFQRD